VDEQAWYDSTDPNAMLALLGERASERRLRLLACACVRRVWGLFRDGRSRQAVGAAERFAERGRGDARAAAAALHRAYRNAVRAAAALQVASPHWYAAQAAMHLAERIGTRFLVAIRDAALAEPGGYQAAPAVQQAQARLLREVFGNPFAPLPARSFPAHAVALAQACYAAFPGQAAELTVLADALADLGEDAAAAHLRQGQHVRGCHVVDWVLGRS
jgi:hypothetical protein